MKQNEMKVPTYITGSKQSSNSNGNKDNAHNHEGRNHLQKPKGRFNPAIHIDTKEMLISYGKN